MSNRLSQPESSASRPPASFVLLWLGAWGLLLAQLGSEWLRNPQYGYGMAVPILMAVILWERRDELSDVFAGATSKTAASGRAPFFLYLAAFLLLPIELLRQVSPQLRSIGVYGLVACLALGWWTLRRLGLKGIPPALGGAALLLATAVPWPAAIEVWVTQSLMKGIASFTSDVLSLGGILAVHRGNLIELRGGVLGVDEACSGVRSLQSCIMASVAIGQFHRLDWSRQAVLSLAGVLLALAGNFVRTLTLSLVASSRGVAGVSRFHDPAGLAILAGVTIVLFWLGRRMAGPERPPSRPWAGPDWRGLPRVWGVCLLGLACLVAAHAWYWSHAARWPLRTEPFLVVKPPPGAHLEEVPVPPAILRVLEPDRAAYFQCHAREWGEPAIYTFFWTPTRENQVGFFHRPDVCMQGAGWRMVGEVRRLDVRIQGVETEWYVFTFERQGKRLLQSWGVWRDGAGQKLDFSRGWKFLGGQHLQIWRYIWEGKRLSNIQIVSVILSEGSPDDSKMARVIGAFLEPRRETP